MIFNFYQLNTNFRGRGMMRKSKYPPMPIIERPKPPKEIINE